MLPKTLFQIAGVTPISSIDPAKTAMLLIDIQMDYFTPGKLFIPDGEAMINTTAKLREWARNKGIHIIHIQQVSQAGAPIFAACSSGVDFHPLVTPQPDEKVIQKGFPSSFRGTELQEYLETNSITTLIITGLMTHMCVETTTRDAAQMGYRAVVVSDACASRDLPTFDGKGIMPATEVHTAALTAMSDRFADIMTATSLMDLE